MASVGLCVVSTAKRGYPLEDAAHIALSKCHIHPRTHAYVEPLHTQGSSVLVWYLEVQQICIV